jgi:hypothetical protein
MPSEGDREGTRVFIAVETHGSRGYERSRISGVIGDLAAVPSIRSPPPRAAMPDRPLPVAEALAAIACDGGTVPNLTYRPYCGIVV